MSKKIEKARVTVKVLREIDIAVGVDWLTATVSSAYPREKAAYDYEKVLDIIYPNDKPVSRPMKLLGYLGEGRGDVFFGERSDGWLMRVTGPKATLATVALINRVWRPTRIDLQITVTLPERSQRDLCDEIFQAAREHPVLSEDDGDDDDQEEAKPRRKSAIYEDERGGKTVYLGSRSSDRFIRIYDKGVQSGQDEAFKMYRFECEFKNRRAWKTWDALARQRQRGWYETIASIVVGELKRKGIYVDLPDGDGLFSVDLSLSVKDGTIERTLSWLSKSVSGSVQRLIDDGYEIAVYNALGLPLPPE